MAKKTVSKKVIASIKFTVPAGNASPGPPVGPALGQHQLGLMDFCKAFNAQTQNMEPDLPIPVVVSVYPDKKFSFVTRTPPAAYLLKRAAGIESGSSVPNKDKVGKVTRAQLEEIVRTKEPDLTAVDLAAAVRTIAGTARSMGIETEVT